MTKLLTLSDGNIVEADFDLLTRDANGYITGKFRFVTGTASVQGDSIWDTEAGVPTTLLENSVVYKHGEQLLVRVRNDGIALTKGQLVYASNAVGNKIIVKPANASVAGQAAGLMGWIASDLATDNDGYAIMQGPIGHISTTLDSEGNALSIGDILYLSASVTGGYTKIPPTTSPRRVGTVLEVSGTTGKILVELGAAIYLREMIDASITSAQNADKLIFDSTTQTWKNSQTDYLLNRNTGFELPNEIGVSYSHTNRTVTLSHSSGTLAWWYRGVRYTTPSPWTSAAHTATIGSWYLTINGAIASASWSQTQWTFTEVMAAYANYQALAVNSFALRETHGLMDWNSHQEAHEALGTYWKSGLSLTAGTYVVYTTSTAPTTVADNTPGVDIGTIKDEDCTTTIPALIEGTYTTAYRSGVNGDWVFDTTTVTPYRVVSNAGQYNQWTGATWQLTTPAEDAYFNVFDFALPVASDSDSQKYRHIWVAGQATFTTLASAQAEYPQNLDLGSLATLSPELVCVNRITYQHNTSGTGNVPVGVTGRVKIMAVDRIRGNRASQIATAGTTPSVHNNLSGRDAADAHPATAISVTGGGTLQAYLDALSSAPSFETVSKNLTAKPYTLNYTAGILTTIVYDLGGGLFITKTLGYTGGVLTTITLSGDTPGGISLVKTLSYTGGVLTGVAYS